MCFRRPGVVSDGEMGKGAGTNIPAPFRDGLNGGDYLPMCWRTVCRRSAAYAASGSFSVSFRTSAQLMYRSSRARALALIESRLTVKAMASPLPSSLYSNKPCMFHLQIVVG